jgi:hypothetical protein
MWRRPGGFRNVFIAGAATAPGGPELEADVSHRIEDLLVQSGLLETVPALFIGTDNETSSRRMAP